MTSTIKTKKELFDNIFAQLDDCSLGPGSKAKVLFDVVQQKSLELKFKEEDASWFCSIILSHTPTNGAGMRKIINQIIERVV